MSRLTDLISQAKAKDPDFGAELEREFKVLSSRRPFGLHFERHRPENVELPGHPIRKGDKVRILPSRGSTAEGDHRLWKVCSLEGTREEPVARICCDDIVMHAFGEQVGPRADKGLNERRISSLPLQCLPQCELVKRDTKTGLIEAVRG